MEEVLKALAENQRALIEAVGNLQKENIEIKAQLAGKSQDKEKKKSGPAEGEATEAELDAIFRNIQI